MVLINFKDEFIDLLFQAYKSDIAIVKDKLSQKHIFSYCMLCDSAFNIFSSAVCTRSWLPKQVEKIKKLISVVNIKPFHLLTLLLLQVK